jgi:hypothetical protein
MLLLTLVGYVVGPYASWYQFRTQVLDILVPSRAILQIPNILQLKVSIDAQSAFKQLTIPDRLQQHAYHGIRPCRQVWGWIPSTTIREPNSTCLCLHLPSQIQYSTLREWADYLILNALNPPQGSLTFDHQNSVNLSNAALKGILGIYCMGMINEALKISNTTYMVSYDTDPLFIMCQGQHS